MHNTNINRRAALLVGLLLALAAPAQADTLMIDKVQTTAGGERPYRGQNMATVESRYGPPAQVLPAIGDPPITRWVYDGYTVYFEGDNVLHSVGHR